ncbi:hypothetical protein [Gimesia sp.]|uniref:hypothetical protein n=1 Tax=Gimesia sp. TaxID=2024833 RepID=UPI0032EC23AE
MYLKKTRYIFANLMTVTFLLTGCSGESGDTPPLGEVTGKITLDGKPLTDASVTFEPKSGAPSLGKTDETGSYVLAYSQDHLGAIPGQHTVRISKFGEPGSPNDTEDQVPDKFNKSSQLTAEVKEGNNTVNFDLESK